MFNFEELEVWPEAIDCADSVYSVTRGFPEDGKQGLTNHISFKTRSQAV